MWKIAIAVMLLATSAFGAVSMNLGPVDADGKIAVDLTGNATLTVTLTGADANNKVNGFDLFALAPVGVVTIAGRNFGTSVMNDAIDSALVGKQLEDSGSVDMGAVAANGVYVTTSPYVCETLTFNVPAALDTVGHPGGIPVDFYFFPTINDMGSVDPSDVQTVIFTPEPASMLLLAAGAAFFVRRRRA